MDSDCLISIIVPVYNVEDYLDRCVQSLVEQTYSVLEIILVDDGSTDSSGELCDKWANTDSRIRVFHKKNGGLSDARNYGIDAVKGEYFLLVDSDDYIENETCEKFLKVAHENYIDFIVGDIREIREKEYRFQRHSCCKGEKCISTTKAINMLIDNYQWYAPAVMNFYRTDFINENKLRFLVGYYYEDLEFLPRLYLSSEKIGFLDYDFYNYVIRKNSIMTSIRSEKKVDDACTVLRNWKILIDTVKDKELQNKLYCALCKHYLHMCRVQKITKWLVPEVDFRFALKHCFNLKEKIKVILFQFFPKLFCLGEAE